MPDRRRTRSGTVTARKRHTAQARASEGRAGANVGGAPAPAFLAFPSPELLEALERLVFPRLVEGRGAAETIRIWVPGCASGETAYCLAIALHGFLERSGCGAGFRLFGTDSSEAAVGLARTAAYSRENLACLSGANLDRYLECGDKGWQVASSIRAICVFARHDFARTVPLARMDLICFRGRGPRRAGAARRQMVGRLAYALRPEGFLVLAPEEELHDSSRWFAPVDKGLGIWMRDGRVPAPRLAELDGPAPRSPAAPAGADGEAVGDAACRPGSTEVNLTAKRQALDAAVGKLRMVNGEAAAAVEALRTAHEDLQAAKHELFASNVELHAFNAALESRNVEMAQLNDDLSNLFRSGHIPIVMLARNLAIRRFTPAAAGLLRLTPEHLGRSITEVQATIDLPDWRAALAPVLGGAEPYEREVTGGGRCYLLRADPYRSSEGPITGLVLTLQDITAQKQTAEARYRRLFESARDGILIVDAVTGKVDDVNPRAEQLFGYTRDELVGIPLWETPPLRGLPTAREAIERLAERDFCRFPELKLPGRSGPGVVAEVIGCSYSEQGRRFLQFNIRDLSERKKFFDELMHAQKLESLGLLAGGIAHDFNNLLTGILGNASMAANHPALAESVRSQLREIMRASERAAFLTRQMLAYAGKGRFVLKRIDMGELIRELSTLARSSIPKIVELNLNLARDLPPVEADPGQMQQLIMNVVINAAEAVGETRGGSVEIRTAPRRLEAGEILDEFPGYQLSPGLYVCVAVIDNGVGMPPETQARIFDPFFTTKFTGRGLGLSAVMGIVHGHGGAIRVSSAPGAGTTFEVLLPVADQPLAGVPRHDAAPRAAGQLVLVIDDEEIVRRVAAAVLERRGFRVLTAENGSEGVKAFAEHADEVSAVLLDLLMPEMGGEEALDRIAGIRPGVPVVLSSGFDESEAARRLGGRRVAGFLQKPYNVDRLLDAIWAVLPDGSRQHRG
jgi:PAS domain S-box-containing protein